MFSGRLPFAATNGTYSIQNGYYSIDARFEENKLVIVEPNKTSTYLKNSSGDYIFTNPTNNITYGMRVLDDKTLEAFKPGVPNSSTILTLKSSAPKVQSASNDGKSNQMKALADKYFKLAETDSDNVHTWANCASVALAYSSLSMDKAKEMELQAATLIKLSQSPVASTSPCSEVISNKTWMSAPSY
ncbi:hypothetical protein [Acinetobacter towneri]|uniref:hypothetical protein n=1 Tax=Acinetobacter towneri TaxID=202956 RepID=UPI002B259DCB|nr:hypothetical protein [Acinetobacter towneri]WPC30965.1 hypothetical protein O4J62_06890 [Acinetobacter towneri]